MPILQSATVKNQAENRHCLGMTEDSGRMRLHFGSRTDGILILVITLFWAYWNYSVTNKFSVLTYAVLLAICCSSYYAGKLVICNVQPFLKLEYDFPLLFLIGFFIISTLLYLSTLFSPFSLWMNGLMLVVLLVAAMLSNLRFGSAYISEKTGIPGILCIIISLLSVTLWLPDSLFPTQMHVNGVLFKPWVDSFIHASQIRMFSNANGSDSLQNIRYAGGAVDAYHFASYIIPALLTSITQSTGYQSYNSFLAPTGLFLTAIAAYSLAKSWWGAWPGLLGALALLAIPDASQQGVKNAYLSYHWMLASAPGLTYGVAIMALAWLFMFAGCRTGSYSAIAISYMTAVLCIMYKAHIFVANSFLLWVFPALFMTGLSIKRRWAWFSISVVIFAAAISLSQRIESIPLIRLDGSAMKAYLDHINQLAGNILLREFFASIDATSSVPYDIFFGALQLSIYTFGLTGIAFCLIAWFFRSKINVMVLIFPFLFILNYLTMSLGLAYDTHVIGTLDELLHRPFVWAYFVLTLWVGGSFYYGLCKDAPPQGYISRVFLIVSVIAAILVPLQYGNNIQSGPDWPLSNIVVPKDLVAVAEYIREHSESLDIVQDSQNDPLFVVSALTNRQQFLVSPRYNSASRHRSLFDERQRELERFKRLTNVADITEYALKHRVRWYLLNPGDSLSWPLSKRDRPIFYSGDFSVYKLY